jgi:hypothetical protein
LSTADVPWLEDHKVLGLLDHKNELKANCKKGPKSGRDARCRHDSNGY